VFLNVALFVSEAVFAMASSAFTAFTGMPTAASNIHPKNTKISFKGKRVTVAKAVGSTAEGIKWRAAKSAARSISGMAFEAAPTVGVVAIVGFTTWELQDLCETAKDIDALNRALNPDDADNESRASVCAIAVPTKEEIKLRVSNQSGELAKKFKNLISRE
jgi:hypothetical protein